jgi:uncharacterized membrane protein
MQGWMRWLLVLAGLVAGYFTWYLLLAFVCFLARRYPSWEAPIKWSSQIQTRLDRLEWYEATIAGLIVLVLVGSVVSGVASLWPSPHTWNQIMFGALLLLVMLGIVALSIFILRSFRSR